MVRRLATAVAIASVAALPGRAATPQATFRASTTLVVQTVMVTDAAGRPVEGLTAADFVVVEDGTPQTLSFAEFQRLSDEIAASPEVRADTPATPGDVAPVTAAGISSSRAGDLRYRDHRLLVFYFDLPGMPPADRLRALWSADAFVAAQMGPADLVAVMTFAGDGVRVKQDFTDDRERLRSTSYGP